MMKATVVISSLMFMLVFVSIAESTNDCNDPNFHSLETSESSKLECGPIFRNRCHCLRTCYDGHHQYVVNCTNTGFQDTSPLTHLPNETQVRGKSINIVRTLIISCDTSRMILCSFRCSSLPGTTWRSCHGMCSALWTVCRI